MSGRKNKNKHRGQQRGQQPQQSTELLDELNSIRDLLGSDELGDIPLLDQVAGPAPRTAPKAPAQVPPEQLRQPVPEPLDESELPILFSPVDEELPEDYKSELNETEKALLRPLQDLPAEPSPAPELLREQQQELFAEPEPGAPPENPFLPAHIRARLTGGRVPRDTAPEEAPDQEAPTAEEVPPAVNPAPAMDTSVESSLATVEEPESFPGAPAATGEPATESEAPSPSERTAQRQQLIDRLVAKQLPELERQLRARIEQMIDELEAKR